MTLSDFTKASGETWMPESSTTLKKLLEDSDAVADYQMDVCDKYNVI